MQPLNFTSYTSKGIVPHQLCMQHIVTNFVLRLLCVIFEDIGAVSRQHTTCTGGLQQTCSTACKVMCKVDWLPVVWESAQVRDAIVVLESVVEHAYHTEVVVECSYTLVVIIRPAAPKVEYTSKEKESHLEDAEDAFTLILAYRLPTRRPVQVILA